MKFDDEICKGISCPECSFNKGEDGCLLAKRLDEIEITLEPCMRQKSGKMDTIYRQAAIDELTENKEMINAVLDSLTLDYNTRRNQEQRRGQINEDIETIKALPSTQPEQAVKDCRNCKHGKYNDYHDTYFCYNAEDCSNWDKWETSAQPEIIHCKECRHNGSFDTDCPIDWNGKEYCSFAER